MPGVLSMPQALLRREPAAPAPGLVHVWYACIEQASEPPLEVLDASDRDRLQKVRDPALRRRRAWSQVILRELLERYLGEPARISRLPAGKPLLTAPAGWLRFSVSRSGAHAAFALARDLDVGIDIERVDRSVPVDRVARRLPRERELIVRGAPHAGRTEAFFRQWTAYEAEVKATGEGLSGGRSAPSGLSVRWPAAPAGHVVAVAARGAVGSVEVRTWEQE